MTTKELKILNDFVKIMDNFEYLLKPEDLKKSYNARILIREFELENSGIGDRKGYS